MPAARETYRAARDEAVARLPGRVQCPEGGSFVFMDLSPWIRAGEVAMNVLERLADQGGLVAPGEAFGHAYATYARLCYTAVSRERLIAGLDMIGAVLPSG